jgi:hypothetical protein
MLMISSVSFVSRQIGHASMSAKDLKSMDLPSMTGIAASGPMSPRPRTAVPSVTTPDQDAAAPDHLIGGGHDDGPDRAQTERQNKRGPITQFS